MVNLITLTAKRRGPGAKDKEPVSYQGVGRIERKETEKDGKTEIEETVITDGVAQSVEDMLPLPGIEGNLQRFLDIAVRGYNADRREAALDVDEFASFIQPEWDEDTVSAFKRSVRALAKVAELETADAAELVLSKMKRTVAA